MRLRNDGIRQTGTACRVAEVSRASAYCSVQREWKYRKQRQAVVYEVRRRGKQYSKKRAFRTH